MNSVLLSRCSARCSDVRKQDSKAVATAVGFGDPPGVWYYSSMKSAAILIALFLAVPASATDIVPVAKFNGWQGPKPEKAPCKCRGREGAKLELGAKLCAKRGDELVTLQCRLVLNNTSWQKVEDGCDVAMN